MLRYLRIYDSCQDWTPSNVVEVDQLARCFLLFLLGSCVFCNTKSSVDLCFLPTLRDLDAIGSYNWGDTALTLLYSFLDKVCQGHSHPVVFGEL